MVDQTEVENKRVRLEWSKIIQHCMDLLDEHQDKNKTLSRTEYYTHGPDRSIIDARVPETRLRFVVQFHNARAEQQRTKLSPCPLPRDCSPLTSDFVNPLAQTHAIPME